MEINSYVKIINNMRKNPNLNDDERLALLKASHALQRCDKEKWHYVSKNPNDLPEDYITVVAYIEFENGFSDVECLQYINRIDMWNGYVDLMNEDNFGTNEYRVIKWKYV